jgi:GNAT superfamily N-acetyltransferase
VDEKDSFVAVIADDSLIAQLADTLGTEHYAYFSACMAYQQDEDKGAEVFVALLGEQPVGALLVRWNEADEPQVNLHLPKVPLFYHVVIREDRRRQGLGTRFVKKVEAWLRGEGHTRAALGVDHSNKDARRFYQALGYVESAEPDLRGLRNELKPDGTLAGADEPYDIFVADLYRA